MTAKRRDRHGRGLRSSLAPRGVPIAQSPADLFDAAILDAIEDLESHGLSEMAGIEFAVEDVPDMSGDGPFSPDVLDDANVPLARAYPGGYAGVASPLVVIYRRPLESRAFDDQDLVDLVRDVVVDRVAHLLGRSPADIDPHIED